MMEITPDKLDVSKVKHLPPNPWRENMHRHITKRKGKRGAHTGIVQNVYRKKKLKR